MLENIMLVALWGLHWTDTVELAMIELWLVVNGWMTQCKCGQMVCFRLRLSIWGFQLCLVDLSRGNITIMSARWLSSDWVWTVRWHNANVNNRGHDAMANNWRNCAQPWQRCNCESAQSRTMQHRLCKPRCGTHCWIVLTRRADNRNTRASRITEQGISDPCDTNCN